jgi:hypothetical protein
MNVRTREDDEERVGTDMTRGVISEGDKTRAFSTNSFPLGVDGEWLYGVISGGASNLARSGLRHI